MPKRSIAYATRTGGRKRSRSSPSREYVPPRLTGGRVVHEIRRENEPGACDGVMPGSPACHGDVKKQLTGEGHGA